MNDVQECGDSKSSGGSGQLPGENPQAQAKLEDAHMKPSNKESESGDEDDDPLMKPGR